MHWPPASGSDSERWERGGHRGGGRGRGRGRGNPTAAFVQERPHQAVDLAADEDLEQEAEEEGEADGELGLDATQEERDEFWREVRRRQASEFRVFPHQSFTQQLVKAREAERKRAIAEGAMDDPLVPKRLEDAITMVGTCMDMCPRFERYRRERENNLTELEVVREGPLHSPLEGLPNILRRFQAPNAWITVRQSRCTNALPAIRQYRQTSVHHSFSKYVPSSNTPQSLSPSLP